MREHTELKIENNKLREEILKLISDITGTDIKRDSIKTSFIEGPDVDSLMALEIVAALEKRYKIEIKEENLSKLRTINNTVALVRDLIKEKQEKQKGIKKIIKKTKSHREPLKRKTY